MAYNGSGTFSLPSGNPVVTGTVISSSWANTTLSQIATGLSTAILKDGQQTVTQNIPFASKKLTLVGDATLTTDVANAAQVQNSSLIYLNTVAGTNTITAAFAGGITPLAWFAGQIFDFIPANTNTGATTLAPGSLAAKNVFSNGAACVGGELIAGIPAMVQYDGTQLNILSAASASALRYNQGGTDALNTTVTIKLREGINAGNDFGVSPLATATQNATRLQSAVNAGIANGVAVEIPPFQFDVNEQSLINGKVTVYAKSTAETSGGARINQTAANKNTFKVTPAAGGTSVGFINLAFKSINGVTPVTGTGDFISMDQAGGHSANATRILGCYFNLPQRNAIAIDKSDDVQIIGNTFDQMLINPAAAAIRLGTNTGADLVSNCRILGNDFFDQGTRSILIYNINQVVIGFNTSYWLSASYSDFFVDAISGSPTQVKNLTVCGNIVDNVVTVVGADAFENLGIVANICNNIGGDGTLDHVFKFTGDCSAGLLTMGNNVVVCPSNNMDIYNDAGATGIKANIVGENYKIGAGVGNPMACTNTTGTIGPNTYTGFSMPGVGGKWTTSGGAFNPGTVNTGAQTEVGLAWPSARFGDRFHMSPVAGTYPVNIGIVVPPGYCTADDVMAALYQNVTGGNISVANHDWTIQCLR